MGNKRQFIVKKFQKKTEKSADKMGNTASGLEFGGTIEDYEDFDPEEDAKALHKAFHKRIGIKEEVIIEILTARSNAQRLEIMDVYAGCYGEDMMDRIEK